MSDYVLPTKVVRAGAECQPIETRFELVDGTAIVSNLFVKAGAFLPQHTHEYAHSSVVAHGRVRVWPNGGFVGEFVRNSIVVIPARAEHVFQALDDGTVVLCIHRPDQKIFEEHQIV